MSQVPFALIIPGQSPIANFECNNNIFHTDIYNPGVISNICLTLVNPLPENYAVTLSFSTPPYTEMQYLGAISNIRPSDVFSTGFPLKPQICQIPTLKLCLKVQSFIDIKDLVLATDSKKQYSKLVAQNLYNYLMSYNRDGLLINNIKGEYLVIPADFLHRWMQKFEQKYAKDPNFILKTTQN